MSTPGRQIHHQPDRILGIKDLNEVIGTLERSGFSEDGWNELGLKLHISQPKLNTVKANNPHDVKGRLRGCLDLWLQQSYDTYKYGLPTLELLAAAAEEMGLKAVASGINPQGSTQSQTKSPKEIQHIIEVYSPNYIKNLKGKFASFKTELLKRLSRHIKDGVIELIDIARFVGATTKVKGLATTASVDDLFDSIQDHFSYLNCEHIEIFVSDFLNDEDKDLKDKMKAYKRDLDNFEKTIKLKQLEKDLDNVRLTHSHSSCKVVIKLVGEWENETLAKLKDFLKHYFKEDSLFNLVCVTDGCLSVTFLVPLSFSQYLIDTATPQLKSMSRVGVLQLIINDVELLDGKDDINLDESLIEAVKLDKPFEVSLLLSLGADPYYEDDNGDKVLELAIQGGNEEIIELISIATDTQVMELESQKELSDEEDRKFENENENLEVEIQKLQDSNAVTTIIPLTHLPNMATARGETGVEINDHLGIEDLGEVISTLEKSEFSDHRWVELGLKLHISQKELDTVGANNPQDVKTCLRKCLAHWLRWNYDVDKYGKPSLEKLKAAVEEMGLRDVADKIAQVKKVKDFCQLITRFEALVDKIHGHLADQVKHQKLQAGKVVRVEFIEEKWKLSEGIPDEVSIDTLFNYIQDHYSFLNCSLIEAIVNKHVDKSSRLQEDMKVYVEEMNHFKHSQCLQDLQYAIENVENYNPSEGSDTSCKVVIKLIGKWDKMIINDLESFLRHYFEDEDVFNYLQITPGSVCISYLVPCSAIAHITTAVKSKSESMHRVGVFYFSINGDILLDEKDVNFNESLIEAVKLCEVYEVSLLLSLGADPCYEDSNGDKALELAKHTGNKEIMQAMATAMDSQVIKRKSQEDLSDEKVNKETTDENEKLKVVIQRLQDSNAELEKSLTASKREIEELQSQKKESEQNSEIDKLKESLAESKSTLAKSKDELLALQKENDKLKESLVETKSTLAKSKDESLALQKENDKLKESLVETKSTLAKSKDELLALQKENDKLLAALAKSKEDSLISLTLQKEYDKFKELLAESKSTLANSKDESQKEYEKLKELLAESKNTLAKREDESQVLQDKILSLGKEVSSLRNELVVKEKMLFEQTEQIKAGNNKIGRILQEKISSLSDRPPCIGACVDKSTQSEAIRNVHFHNANNYEDVAQIPISKSLLEHFTSIRISFGCMMYNVLGVIKELKRPLDKLKEFLLCTYEGYDSKLKSKLDSCSDISSLFHVIRGECSLTNISLLEAVAKKFDFIEEVWEYIMEYKETLQKFCWLLLDICKVDDLRSIVVPSKPQPHLQCITFILNWEPEEHVLKDIKEILAKITEPYGRLIIIKIVCIESIPHD